MNLDQILASKPVLFVDDDPDVISGYRNALRKKFPNQEPLAWTSLAEAMENFVKPGTTPNDFAIILLDLHIPPVPTALKEYERRLGGVGLNHGQTLGWWLSEKFPTVPYGYLSVVPEAFIPGKDSPNRPPHVINKIATLPSQLLREIEKILHKY